MSSYYSGQSMIPYSFKLEHQRFPLFSPKVHQFLNYKHFYDYHIPLVDFQSADVIQIYNCFGRISLAGLLT